MQQRPDTAPLDRRSFCRSRRAPKPVRTQSRELVLGDSLAAFMRKLGMRLAYPSGLPCVGRSWAGNTYDPSR